MKKSYVKPEAKKISFAYEQVVVASGGYCDQGWTQKTNLDPYGTCDKCYGGLIWIGSTKPN